MKTIIAEKRSVAKVIANAIGANHLVGQERFGYFEGGGWLVTWAAGHLLQAVAPDTDGKFNAEDLPVIPERFILIPNQIRNKEGKLVNDPACVKQLKYIKECFDKSDSVINAGDAGREGEVIQRNIYEYLKLRKPVSRLWLQSLTDDAIQKGLKELRPSSEFDNLYTAGKCHGEADWIVGINATRALRAATGIRTGNTLGRVQTPTLAMVCHRYLENKNFVPEDFWTLVAKAEKNGIEFQLTSANKYKTETEAQFALSMARENDMVIDNIESKDKTAEAPLLYDLTALQKAANTKYGMTAQQTLEIAQNLYQKQYTTYPRTASRHITEETFKTVPKIIRTFENHPSFGTVAKKLGGTPRLNRHSVNDDKVADHEALMVTGIPPTGLDDEEKAIYRLIAIRMMEAFSPPCKYRRTMLEALAGNILFKAAGNNITFAGWKEVQGVKADEQTDDETENNGPLPPLKAGEILNVTGIESKQGITKPKPLLTDASLLSMMESAGRDSDESDVKEAMKDIGLGTPATRAACIEKIIKVNYIERKGDGKAKKLIPTANGLAIYNLVRTMDIANVEMTGRWEHRLTLVEEGQENPKGFNEEIVQYAGQITREILNMNTTGIVKETEQTTICCPRCGATMKSWRENIKCPDCSLTVWRTVFGKSLPDKTLKPIIEKGSCGTIHGFINKQRKTFSAGLRRELPSDGDPSNKITLRPVFDNIKQMNPQQKKPAARPAIPKRKTSWGKR